MGGESSDCRVFVDGHCAGSGVFEPRRAVNRRSEESPLLGWRVGVDPESLAVDHDMVVKPTHRGEVHRIRPPTIDPAGDVMDLEPIPAHTARNRAHRTITSQHEPSQAWRDHPTPPTQRQRDTVRCACRDLNHSVAQDRLDRRLTDPRSCFDRHRGLATGGCCIGGVDEHGEQRCRRLDRGAVTASKTVEADRPQRIHIPCGPRRRARVDRERVGFRFEGLDNDAASRARGGDR